ncbi:MAG TPA: NGG1p interacting factor NIF3 [Porticoccaceae bacterium]|nr:NGG1p interacting factor NIF3 [Porticoccaceae bacterium]
MFKLDFYVPESHLESVKQAVFEAGAGRIGNYDQCCWQNAGQGQFRPLDDSNPFLGVPGQLEKVLEYKVEMICEASVIDSVIKALRAAHPYEEPAFQVIRIESFS